LLKTGQDNIIAMLTESLGGNRSAPEIDFFSPEEQTPLKTEVAWKLIGADGAMRQTLLSPMNASGLYGERYGWYKPGLNDSIPEWQHIHTPHEFRAPDAWIGWYRTTFDLKLSAGIDAPMALVLDKALTGNDKAIMFINGYNMGRFWPERGPQTRFFIPAGVLNTNGKNNIAIAVWRRSIDSGGLGIVKLAPFETNSVLTLGINK